MGHWYRYPGSQIPGSVLLDLHWHCWATELLIIIWVEIQARATDQGWQFSSRLSGWVGEGAPADTCTATKGSSRVVHIWVFMRPLLPHNTTPSQRDPSPGDGTCPQGTLVPENLHFFKQWKPVLSLGLTRCACIVCLGNQYLNEWPF